MTITTSRGQTFNVNWAWAQEDENRLMIELPETRSIGEIAADFDGLEKIDRRSESEGDRVYEGYDALTRVIKDTDKGTALLTMERSAANG